MTQPKVKRVLYAALAAVVLALAPSFLGGCTPWATYPAIEGATGAKNPTMQPIPNLMAEGIWHAYVRDRGGDSRDIVFNLPPDTPAIVYESVQKKLGGGRPMTEPGEPAYHVTEVRIRATEAEVDVIRPGDGTPQQVTLFFKQDVIKGYQLARTRAWRYPVSTPWPAYPAVAPEEAHAGASDDAERGDTD
jgi:hypothetical protein